MAGRGVRGLFSSTLFSDSDRFSATDAKQNLAFVGFCDDSIQVLRVFETQIIRWIDSFYVIIDILKNKNKEQDLYGAIERKRHDRNYSCDPFFIQALINAQCHQNIMYNAIRNMLMTAQKDFRYRRRWVMITRDQNKKVWTLIIKK